MQERHYPSDRPRHVYLFATCLVDLFVPHAGLDDCVIVASTEVNDDADRAAYASALSACLASKRSERP